MKSENNPNIILINVESMDGRKMGCMGNQALQNATPNLDRFAREGVLFKNAYSNCPVCNPSRASMWTGKYPHYYNCWNNHEGITEDIPILLDQFKDNGYLTKTIGPLDYQYGLHSIRDQVGSWTRAANIQRPLCRTILPKVYDNNADINKADWQRTYEAIDFLHKANLEEKPFMLYLTTGLVHPAFKALKRHVDLIDEDKIEIPPIDETNHPVLNYQKVTKNTAQGFSDNMVREIRKIYFAMIAALDEMFGQLMLAIENMNLKENTYIIFTSDHGEMAMEHSQILKRTMYEPSIHIPLIVNGPGIKKDEEIENPVSLIDIYPTLMEMAGLKIPSNLDGESLLSLLKGEKSKRRDLVFAEYHGDRCNTGTFMLRKDEWKYIKYIGYEPLLFNLKQDPWEINNLATKEVEKVKELDKILESICDYEAIDSKAKQYDKENFRNWRKQQIKQGTYKDTMARIYSGFDNLCIDDIMPWTEKEETLILEWLENK